MPQPALYPLRFEPLFRRYIWGGRRLETVLGKPLPPGDDYAESWEVVDHGQDQSVVAHGPLQGASLGDLVGERGEELLGGGAPRGRFPLLFKFLDANRTLSVQVHPNDEQAAHLDPPDYGKTEAWVILAAEPGSVIYSGLKRGFDRPALEREIARGATELCLHKFEPKVGDCLFIPAGTVHALGGGLVVAEIQQSSDTTFRLYDWNRTGADGKPRALHVEQALEVIDFDAGPVPPVEPQPTNSGHIVRLVSCDKFVMDRWRFDQPQTLETSGGFHLLAVLAGAVELEADPSGQPLRAGQTTLAPAAIERLDLNPTEPTTLLDIYLP